MAEGACASVRAEVIEGNHVTAASVAMEVIPEKSPCPQLRPLLSTEATDL